MNAHEVEGWSSWIRRKQVLGEVEGERYRQLALWGPDGHEPFHPARLANVFLPESPEGVAEYFEIPYAAEAKLRCQLEHERGGSSWLAILIEEVAEAAEEAALGDAINLRTELVQVAAVVVAWIEDLDRAASEARDEAIERAYEAIANREGL